MKALFALTYYVLLFAWSIYFQRNFYHANWTQVGLFFLPGIAGTLVQFAYGVGHAVGKDE